MLQWVLFTACWHLAVLLFATPWRVSNTIDWVQHATPVNKSQCGEDVATTCWGHHTTTCWARCYNALGTSCHNVLTINVIPSPHFSVLTMSEHNMLSTITQHAQDVMKRWCVSWVLCTGSISHLVNNRSRRRTVTLGHSGMLRQAVMVAQVWRQAGSEGKYSVS